ncbi:helix-turn-helix transcriptional regulator [Gemmiger formicilis]|uniref:helix-turn-helix domain-containing protein n=1 Tax=Gemmiger formicilis TaxID=745368 RepID=UPI00195EB4F5|nr:helix-turn-helix transcriptional regulator [Gemmiger formicilis]MBM6899410.1 helix-turn-helix transcriptional regulator [Gemmiger formicilis]
MSRERKAPIIAGRVKELRTERHLTQEEFAESIGVATNTISRIERKEMSLSSEVALKIADEYKISLDWLFGRSEEEIPVPYLQNLQEALDCISGPEIVE